VAYQQSQVPCPPNEWTQICQYRQSRKSLSVQCPQVGTLTRYSEVLVDSGPTTVLAPASALRRSVVFAQNSGDIVSLTTTGITGGIPLGSATSQENGPFPGQSSLNINDLWGQWTQAQWSVLSTALDDYRVMVWEEIYQCAGIILATTQNTAVTGGPYGSQPPGIWVGPDFGSGPTNWHLDYRNDDEAVIQQWYCWPVGSITVNVTVTESWEIDQPPETPEKFPAVLPGLSPDAIAALDALIAKYGDIGED
jgi:hypothetical protein